MGKPKEVPLVRGDLPRLEEEETSTLQGIPGDM